MGQAVNSANGRRRVPGVALALLGCAFAAQPVAAQRIENGTAVFAALDKVTARISRLEVPLGETREFGALKITARACFSRPPTEPPKTSTFAEVDELQLDGNLRRIFSGWMFAESPGLNAVEHPVFDVWLTECAKPKSGGTRPGLASPRQGVPGAPAAAGAPPIEPEDDTFRRRRPPR